MSIAQKIKVLIVDDQVTSRLLLGDALQQLGFTQITVAGDGEQGAKIMAQQPHHLVIFGFQHAENGWLGFSPGGPVQSGNQESSLYHADGPG
jgi:two-component system chemotaxis response regulator CheY